MKGEEGIEVLERGGEEGSNVGGRSSFMGGGCWP